MDDIIINIFRGRKKQLKFNFKVSRPVQKEKVMVELTCSNEEKILITVNPVTHAGHPVALDGPVDVQVQGGDASVEMVDNNSFYVISGDNPGDTTYLVSGDADLGAGVEAISDVIILHVEGARAQSLGLTAGAPELK